MTNTWIAGMHATRTDIEAGAVLPTSLELLRAVRGHSVDAAGGPLARLVSSYALRLAELHATDVSEMARTDIRPSCDNTLDRLETLLTAALPHLPTEDIHVIGRTIERIARASVELHRALRRFGGADGRVRLMCRRTAALADQYTDLTRSAALRQPWLPRA
ncbi:hypothetical protein NLM24_18950 [Nocardia zapadnayensis]|uniref:hypothetical protein n=1 Tax=Nocardia rhamnosiphila TaxID=426716 RepID=UPI002246839E|nr:hypothetical protein [Nocardia zapadnayensis]MCX0272745.1 hypothetical protein [Nocardia zapadnayensis]